MSIIKKNDNLFPAIPSFFNDVLSRDLWNWGLNNNSSTNTTIPAVNIRENKDSFIVEMVAPGMKKDDFKVELDDNMLTISSEKNMQDEIKDGENYTRQEFSYQSFQRTFQLPKNVVDADKINAKYENGLLQLTIPKREEAKQKPRRMINIS